MFFFSILLYGKVYVFNVVVYNCCINVFVKGSISDLVKFYDCFVYFFNWKSVSRIIVKII